MTMRVEGNLRDYARQHCQPRTARKIVMLVCCTRYLTYLVRSLGCMGELAGCCFRLGYDISPIHSIAHRTNYCTLRSAPCLMVFGSELALTADPDTWIK
jgi:hypothetical protein